MKGAAVMVLAAASVGAVPAARGQSPSPPLPPQNLPALSPAPTQSSVPPVTALPEIPPLDGHVAPPNAPQPQLQHAADTTVEPEREGVTGLRPDVLGFLGPYRRPTVPPLFEGSATRLEGLIRGGKLYLTLQDAIALALENNLDVEAERYNLTLARTDVVRAQGGGSTRGLDYSGGDAAERCGRAGVAAAECDDGEQQSDDADGDGSDGAELDDTGAAVAVGAGDGVHVLGGAECAAVRSAADWGCGVSAAVGHAGAGGGGDGNGEWDGDDFRGRRLGSR